MISALSDTYKSSCRGGFVGELDLGEGHGCFGPVGAKVWGVRMYKQGLPWRRFSAAGGRPTTIQELPALRAELTKVQHDAVHDSRIQVGHRHSHHREHPPARTEHTIRKAIPRFLESRGPTSREVWRVKKSNIGFLDSLNLCTRRTSLLDTDGPRQHILEKLRPASSSPPILSYCLSVYAFDNLTK